MKNLPTSLRAGFAALAVALVAPLAASAQSAAPPSYATREESIHGTITSFDGHYALTVHDANGYTDRVQLHDGTVINPRGLTLAAGMTVTIYGSNQGSIFAANEIDTPYHRTYVYGYPYAYPYAGYYGPGPYWNAGLGVWIR